MNNYHSNKTKNDGNWKNLLVLHFLNPKNHDDILTFTNFIIHIGNMTQMSQYYFTHLRFWSLADGSELSDPTYRYKLRLLWKKNH